MKWTSLPVNRMRPTRWLRVPVRPDYREARPDVGVPDGLLHGHLQLVAGQTLNWLFPGIRPGTHRSTGPLSRALAAHGVPLRPSRATALLQLAQDMPPAVLAPLLGMHVITAQQWRRRTGTDWTTHLQARRRALGAGRTPPVQR